jgi:hypothetical protein
MSKTKHLILMLLFAGLLLVSCTGGGGNPSPFDSWFCASLTAGGIQFQDMVMTVTKDGTFTASYTELQGTWQAGSHYGTFSPVSMPENTDLTFSVISGSGLYPGNGSVYLAKYDGLTLSALNMYLNLGSGFEGPFAMQRQ